MHKEELEHFKIGFKWYAIEALYLLWLLHRKSGHRQRSDVSRARQKIWQIAFNEAVQIIRRLETGGRTFKGPISKKTSEEIQEINTLLQIAEKALAPIKQESTEVKAKATIKGRPKIPLQTSAHFVALKNLVGSEKRNPAKGTWAEIEEIYLNDFAFFYYGLVPTNPNVGSLKAYHHRCLTKLKRRFKSSKERDRFVENQRKNLTAFGKFISMRLSR